MIPDDRAGKVRASHRADADRGAAGQPHGLGAAPVVSALGRERGVVPTMAEFAASTG
jgi:hypothetical protein